MTPNYVASQLSRNDVDAVTGPLVLEFGTDWCGYCQAAASAVDTALKEFSAVQHIRIEDGPGRRLGRSFQVKLWPTLIFLKDGVEVARAVRPQTKEDILTGLRQIC